MPINKTDVAKIAELARLDLAEQEAEAFAEQLSAILGYIDKLNELDTSNVEPMSHSSSGSDDTGFSLRDDVARPSLGAKLATENAPDPEDGFFKVPKVIGG
jgi:aspartyl-tRNA(Asn)/glutamyl-tRNA(Gln) amidotransferase subunit C